MPLGTDVDRGAGHILLDGGPTLRERVTAALPTLFSAHVYCGNGRPSQLLLSSSFFPRLISAVAEWTSTILLHMVWP